jgi:nucleoid-associated protein YgaU
MVNEIQPIRPPSSVPGPHRIPKSPPAIPTQHLPGVRYYTAQGSETLRGLAEAFYGNGREAQRIFNANRFGMLRDDKTMGVLRTMEDTLPAGTVLLIP